VAPSAINSLALVAGLGTLDFGCAMPIDRNDLPNHLFGIPDLDLSEDLCAEPLAGPWFRLGGVRLFAAWPKRFRLESRRSSLPQSRPSPRPELFRSIGNHTKIKS
jgi:hypothetical protein